MEPPVGTGPGAVPVSLGRVVPAAPPPGNATVGSTTTACVPARRRGGWKHVTLARPSRAAGVPVVVPPFLVVAAILLLALNMRGPIVAVSPVLDAISADLGISATTAGLLTGLPVLCFGLATPAASALLARAGLGRGVSISLVVLLAGMLLRSVGGLPTALAGTLLIGIAITVGNVAVPGGIARDPPRPAGPGLGAHTAAPDGGAVPTPSPTGPPPGAPGGLHRGAERRRDADPLADSAARGVAGLADGGGVVGRAGGGGPRSLDLRHPGSGPQHTGRCRRGRSDHDRPGRPHVVAPPGGVAADDRVLGPGLRLLRRHGVAAAAAARRARDGPRRRGPQRVDLPDRRHGRRLRGAGAAAGTARATPGRPDRRGVLVHPAARAAARAGAVAGVVLRGRCGPGWRARGGLLADRAVGPRPGRQPADLRAGAGRRVRRRGDGAD